VAENLAAQHKEQMRLAKGQQKKVLTDMRERHRVELTRLQEISEETRAELDASKKELRAVSDKVEQVGKDAIEKERAMCRSLLRSAEQNDASLRNRARISGAIVVMLVGLGSAWTILGFPLSPILAIFLAVGVLMASVFAASQVFNGWMRPLDGWLFRRKVNALEWKLEEMGRLDLIGHFEVKSDEHTLSIGRLETAARTGDR
jgi:hypothetical protein